MCATITKAYVPHNVGKEQGRLNLKVEEKDLWGGKAKKTSRAFGKGWEGGSSKKQYIVCFNTEHLAKAGRGGSGKTKKLLDPPQIQIRSLRKRLGGRIDRMVDPPSKQLKPVQELTIRYIKELLLQHHLLKYIKHTLN